MFALSVAATMSGAEMESWRKLTMPTREQAIGNVIMLALSPAQRLVSQILGPASSVASQIKQLSEKKEEEAKG